MKINTDDDGVFEYEMTVEEARAFGDDEESVNKMIEALDGAQEHVFGGDGEVAYLIISIRR